MAWRKGRRKLKSLADLRLYLSDLISRYDRSTDDIEEILASDRPTDQQFANLVRALSVMSSIIRDADLENRIAALETLASEQAARR